MPKVLYCEQYLPGRASATITAICQRVRSNRSNGRHRPFLVYSVSWPFTNGNVTRQLPLVFNPPV